MIKNVIKLAAIIMGLFAAALHNWGIREL